ncbi:MAG: hypothetical protein ACI82G_003370 [Bradymonadia bacterium]|jgi:hypothetical protein
MNTARLASVAAFYFCSLAIGASAQNGKPLPDVIDSPSTEPSAEPERQTNRRLRREPPSSTSRRRMTFPCGAPRQTRGVCSSRWAQRRHGMSA